MLVYVLRHRLRGLPTGQLLATGALLHAAATLVALAFLVRIRVGLNYSPRNLALMLSIYLLAALPFLTGGTVISAAFARLTSRINLLYAADLIGAAAGCLALIPLLNTLGAPGVVLVAAGVVVGRRAVCFTSSRPRARGSRRSASAILALPLGAQLAGVQPFDVRDTKGHEGDRVLFSKWNSFSRIAVYDRAHGDWSLSPTFTGSRGESRFMDIDSAASTPILKGTGHVVGRRLSALRTDGPRLPARRAARRDSRRWSSVPAADAICCRRWSSAPRTSMASRSIRSSFAT